MRRPGPVLTVLLLLTGILGNAQTAPTASPQTARQALLEMFLGKDPDSFAKHLPDDARKALIHKGETPETSSILRFSQLLRQEVSRGETIESFDTGPVLLASGDSNNYERSELLVDRDSLGGDADEIEVSFRHYKKGQLEELPVIPQAIFTLKQEKEVWRLTEVTVSAHVPLTDPDYLKSLRRQEDESTESAALNRLRVIAAAETGYAGRHPDLGYTCSLTSLFAREPGANPGEEGFNYDPGQSNEEWNRYRFLLTGCDGTPAGAYRVRAAPLDTDSSLKTFCADESGKLKSLAQGKSSSCFSRGELVDKGVTSPATD